MFQGSAESALSQQSSDVSLEDDPETVRHENEQHARAQLEKSKVSCTSSTVHLHLHLYSVCFYGIVLLADEACCVRGANECGVRWRAR